MDFTDPGDGGGGAAGGLDIEDCIHESISGTDLQDLVDSICGLPESSTGFHNSDLPESPPESGTDALSPVYYGQSPGKQQHQPTVAAVLDAAKYPDLSSVDYTLPLQIIQEEQYVKREVQDAVSLKVKTIFVYLVVHCRKRIYGG